MFSTCIGTEEDILTIKDIRFDPYPLQLGHNFDLHIEGILSKTCLYYYTDLYQSPKAALLYAHSCSVKNNVKTITSIMYR